ncbi:MAG: PAS domain-containing protein [Deltaproteobacteria bacterium]|nr:PAS domain-containing protein [Deltaproteobacteria bacterium]
MLYEDFDKDQLRGLVELIPCVVYFSEISKSGSDWSFRLVGKWIVGLTGYQAEDFENGRVSWLTIIFPEDIERVLKSTRSLFEKETQLEMRYRIITNDGQIKWLQDIKRSVFKNGKPVMISGVLLDISEKMKMDEELIIDQVQLRSLATDIHLVEEKERRKLASELHDSIGQILTFTKLKLDQLSILTKSASMLKTIKEVKDLVKDMIQRTRMITFELSPPVLHEIGLEAALISLASQLNGMHKMKIKIVSDKLPRELGHQTSLLLFRTANELLTNVLKHSRTKDATIYLENDKNTFQLTVQDDGVGFDVDATFKGIGDCFGLFNIKERLSFIGGDFKIISNPGKGTKVVLTVPNKQYI